MHLIGKLSRVEAVYCFFTLCAGVESDTDLYTPLDSSLCILGATYLQHSREGSVFIADLLWATQVNQIIKLSLLYCMVG